MLYEASRAMLSVSYWHVPLQVDDSRKTLSCAVTELLKDIQQERQSHQQSSDQPWVEPQLGVFVVHNKQREKLGQLPEDIMRNRWATSVELDQQAPF